MTETFPEDFIKYALIEGGECAILGDDLVIDTPITGYSVEITDPGRRCKLETSGRLTMFGGDFIWDFGSYAVDTPAMVRASAPHDVFCWMTDLGLLPWSVRAQSDAFFREVLKKYMPTGSSVKRGFNFARRWWCWAGVRTYSVAVAYRKRKPFKPYEVADSDA